MSPSRACFFLCFQSFRLRISDGSIEKIVADNPLLAHFGMDNRTYEKVTQRTIGAEFEQIIRGVKLTPLHELLSYI